MSANGGESQGPCLCLPVWRIPTILAPHHNNYQSNVPWPPDILFWRLRESCRSEWLTSRNFPAVFGVPEAGSQVNPQPDGRTSSTEAIGDFSDGNSSNVERVQSFDLDPFERLDSSASVLERVPTPRIDDLADQNISAVLISSAPKLGPASTLLHGDDASTTADDGNDAEFPQFTTLPTHFDMLLRSTPAAFCLLLHSL
jgi:hypothetical protein